LPLTPDPVFPLEFDMSSSLAGMLLPVWILGAFLAVAVVDWIKTPRRP